MSDFYIGLLIVGAAVVALCPLLAFLFGKYVGLGLAAAQRVKNSNNEDQDGNAKSQRTRQSP